MKDFYRTEKFRIQLAAMLAGVGYVLAMLLLWLRLKHLYGSFVYPRVNGTLDTKHPESFASWLTPWCVYLAVTALVAVCAVVILIYARSFNGKDPCVDCREFDEVTNFTNGYDDDARQYVCARHLDDRREQAALEAAVHRARAQTVGQCPRCQKPMRKAIQKVLGVHVVSDICEAHGRYSDWPEVHLFHEEAYQEGLHARVSRGPAHHAATVTVLHAVHADTAPIMYLDELGQAS